jgi:hypothetical protein
LEHSVNALKYKTRPWSSFSPAQTFVCAVFFAREVGAVNFVNYEMGGVSREVAITILSSIFSLFNLGLNV